MSSLRATVVVLTLTAVAGGADAALAQSLPSGLGGGPVVFYLEIVVNGRPTARVIPVDYREGSYHVAAEELRAVSIRTDAPDGTRVAVDRLADVDVEYDGHQQRLLITVPPDWLPVHAMTSAGRSRTPAETSTGVVLNYDLHLNSARGARQLSGWSEQRLFARWGTLATTGVYRSRFGRDDRSFGYVRYDTSWRYADEDRAVTYAAGDVVTGGLPWTTAVRVGGVSIGRTFNVRPDLITYPLPQFTGRAVVPSTVDVFIEGRPTLRGDVPPGPFVVDDLPLVTGAGTATIVTTDALGRQVSTDVSFYVANTLLRKGLVDYSASAGFVRRGFGVRSISYGRPVAVGSLRYGATDHISIAAHLEGGPRQLAASGGIDMSAGNLGVVGLSFAESRHIGQSGRQLSASYSYAMRRFGINARHTQRTDGFADLSVHDRPLDDISIRRALRTSQVTAAVQLGGRAGTLSAGAFHTVDADDDRRTVATISYHRPFLWSSSLHVSLYRRLDREHREHALQLQAVVPLGSRHGSVTARMAHGSERTTGGVYYRRAAPLAGGVGWNAGYSSGSNDVRHADVTWRTRYAQLEGGLRGDGSSPSGWSSLSGAAIFMDGAAFATSRVADAFVLVDTDGHEGVPVRFEHQLVGTTNRRGHLMVPWAAAYYPASYQIDPLTLDADVQAPVTERRVAVRRHSGLVVKFPLRRVAAALVTLIDERGRAIPVGSTVVHDQSGQVAVVGWDGLVYLEEVQASNHLSVSLPHGRQCTAVFSFEAVPGELPRVGPVPCR